MKKTPRIGPKPLGLVGRDHPALHRPAETIEHVTPSIQMLARRMAATLAAVGGKGLAACQVGVSLQLVVVNPAKEASRDARLETFIALGNPRIDVDEDGGEETGTEGCLSLPGRWFEVPRHRHVLVAGVDVLQGHLVKGETWDLDARCWLHELDHIEGRLLLGRYPEV